MSTRGPGNRRRCACKNLAAVDGYCVHCRPKGFVEDEDDYHFARSTFVPTESGYREGRIGSKDPHPFGEKFGLIQDKFGIETKYEEFDEPSVYDGRQEAALIMAQRKHRQASGKRRERRRY